MSCKWLFKIKEGTEGFDAPLFGLYLHDYELERLDVKTTFLYGNLEEEIYMRQLPGYEQCNKFNGSSYDSCLYYRSYAPGARGSKENSWYGDREGSESQDSEGVTIRDCPVRDCDAERISNVSYENAVGSLMYLMGTANVGLVYGTDRGNRVDVTGFIDSDYAKDPDKGRSIMGYAFLAHGYVVSGKATLQHVVTLSTTEAGYMALMEAVKEAIWLKGLLEELGVKLNTVAVNCDHQGAIHLSRNHVFHERTKHINVRYHFMREVLEANTVEVLNVGTKHNGAVALTKVVPGLKLQHCLELLSVGVG
ncbi:hypothetical protein Tco_0637065 [Tanacetum coccineum]